MTRNDEHKLNVKYAECLLRHTISNPVQLYMRCGYNYLIDLYADSGFVDTVLSVNINKDNDVIVNCQRSQIQININKINLN